MVVLAFKRSNIFSTLNHYVITYYVIVQMHICENLHTGPYYLLIQQSKIYNKKGILQPCPAAL